MNDEKTAPPAAAKKGAQSTLGPDEVRVRNKKTGKVKVVGVRTRLAMSPAKWEVIQKPGKK